jgi:Undecaprenyl-phosphate glucose phosphotransferase
MPYDTVEVRDRAGGNRRGPLRPERLVTARSRLGGEALTQLVRGADIFLIAALFVQEGLQGVTHGAAGLLLTASLFTVATLVAFDSYQFGARERLHRHLYRVIGAVGGAGLMMLAVASLLPPAAKTQGELSLVDWCLKAVTVVGLSHAVWFGYIMRLRRRGLLTPNLIVVGATPAAQRLIAVALSRRDVNVLGVFDDRRERAPKHIFGVPVLGRTKDVISHRLLPYVDRVVLAVPPQATARISELIEALAPAPNAISLLMEGHDAESEREAHERLLDMPLAHLTGVRRGPMQAILKRVIDVGFSTAGLVVLIPALVAIAIAIKLDSPGPVFFKQRRHGYLNEEVLVWKFRSMRTEASDYSAARQVTADDDRVTPVGRFLRRTSLDELPQLWNVIRGEMSLVGPRPHAIGMLTGGAEASKLVATYAHRHRMKPGLTGWAAVNGSRGPVDTPEAVRRRVSLDLEYVERQSVWLDLAIIARTLPCVLGDSEAVR